jgi:hypothetical protein
MPIFFALAPLRPHPFGAGAQFGGRSHAKAWFMKYPGSGYHRCVALDANWMNRRSLLIRVQLPPMHRMLRVKECSVCFVCI